MQEFIKLRKSRANNEEFATLNSLREYFSYVKYLFLMTYVDNKTIDKLLEKNN